MSVARRDDRHNDDLVREISDSFNRAVAKRPDPAGTAAARAPEGGDADSAAPAPPQFVVTGDKRDAARGKRRGG